MPTQRITNVRRIPDGTVFLTAKEAGGLIYRSARFIERKIEAGELTGYRIGKALRVRPADLVDFINKHRDADRFGKIEY